MKQLYKGKFYLPGNNELKEEKLQVEREQLGGGTGLTEVGRYERWIHESEQKVQSLEEKLQNVGANLNLTLNNSLIIIDEVDSLMDPMSSN